MWPRSALSIAASEGYDAPMSKPERRAAAGAGGRARGGERNANVARASRVAALGVAGDARLSELRQLRSELIAAETSLASLRELERQIVDLGALASSYAERVDRLEAENSEQRAALAVLASSSSWRLTAPLRAAAARLRRARR
jgi:hypothetical protein